MLHRQVKTPAQASACGCPPSERTLLETLGLSEDAGTEAVRQTPQGQPIRLTPDELDQLLDELAVELEPQRRSRH